MTRNEAIRIFLKHKMFRTNGSEMFAADYVDAFVTLGMLKLDEPQTAGNLGPIEWERSEPQGTYRMRFVTSMKRRCMPIALRAKVFSALEDAELELTEKSDDQK